MNINTLVEQALATGNTINEVIVINRTNELINQAKLIFNIELPDVEIKLNLNGVNAGLACKKNNKYSVHFNSDMIHNDSLMNIIKDTIPHELAHIICMVTKWGKNHDNTWKNVCKKLGGTGNRIHNEKFSYAHGNYEYQLSTGEKICLSKIRHNRIQNGSMYYKGNNIITKECFCKKVEVL